MLPPEYFNGDRIKKYLMLMDKLSNINTDVKKDTTSREKIGAVSIHREAEVKIIEEVGIDYLVPFSNDARLVRRDQNLVTYEVPGNFGFDKVKDEIERDIVTVKVDVVKSVVYNLQTGDGAMDENRVEELEQEKEETGDGDEPVVNSKKIIPEIGIIQRDSPYPPPVFSENDGQLKLTVDCLLATEDMVIKEKKDYYKVLVIGSSSPGGVRAGVAYKMFPFLMSGSVDLYDPYEMGRQYELKVGNNSVQYTAHDKRFNYEWLDKKFKDYYDLIIDDTWEVGTARSVRDSNDLVSRCKNFSIKQFPWERDPDKRGNVYAQKFWTAGKEERRVSRDVNEIGIVNDIRFGRCGACMEMRLRSRLKYEDGFFPEFMSCHKQNCKNKSRNNDVIITLGNSWIEVIPFVYDLSGYACLNFDPIDGANVVNSEIKGKEDVKFIFSKRKRVPSDIFITAYQVLVVENDKYYVSRLCGEQRVSEVEKAKVEALDDSVNFTHSSSSRERLLNGKRRYGKLKRRYRVK